MIGDRLADVQAPLHARNQAGRLRRRARILQVVQRPAVGHRAQQRRQFERRLLNLLPEAGQHSHPAVSRGRRRIVPRLLAGDVQSGLLPVSEQVGIVAHLREAELFSQRGEIEIVGVRQGVRQVHLPESVEAQFGGRFDDFLAQCRQRHRNLDGGARLKAGAQRDLLVHHREHPPGPRVHHHHGAVVGPQRRHRGPADIQILGIHIVAFGGIGISRLLPGTAANDRRRLAPAEASGPLPNQPAPEPAARAWPPRPPGWPRRRAAAGFAPRQRARQRGGGLSTSP